MEKMRQEHLRLLFVRLLCLVSLVIPCLQAAEKLPKPRHSYLVKTVEEFNQAAQKVSAGDEIVLAKGNWTNVQLNFNADGKKGKMIYVRGEDPKKCIIDGTSQINIGGDYIYLHHLSFKGCVATSPSRKGSIVNFRTDSKQEANYSIISDCHFDSCVPEDKSFDDVWINLYGTYNTVQYCTMEGKDNMGLYIVVWHKNNKADHHVIKNNYFTRPLSYNREQNGQEIIRIGDSNNSLTDSNCIIENNYFYQCNGEIEIISIKSGQNIVRGNTFMECKGAVTLRHGNNNTVESNIFIANGAERAGGVRVINKGQKVINNYFYGHISDGTRAPISLMQGVKNGELNTYNQVEDALIANNTLVDCKYNFAFCVQGKNTTLDPVRTTIKNCLVVTDKVDISKLIDSNGGDTSGIKWEACHLEGRDGLMKDKGFIKAQYTKSSMKIEKAKYPILTSKIGASISKKIALPANCGASFCR